MPSLHDFRTNFRYGRVGGAMRVRQDAQPYTASLKDAANIMICADGSARRRWGTIRRATLGNSGRLEAWEYSTGINGKFLLLFTAGRVDIYNYDLSSSWAVTSMPWTADTLKFMSITIEDTKLYITDVSFQTQVITLDPSGPSFSAAGFAFKVDANTGRLRAPFYQFVNDTITCTPTIFTSADTKNGTYATHLQTALSIAPGDFNLAAGTGKLATSAAFFEAEHVGTRLRIADGEVVIDSVVDSQNATITVVRDIAVQLDNNPFWVRKGSRIAEVAAKDHGLAVGNTVFFAGLSTVIPSGAAKVGTYITGACEFKAAPTSTAKTYAVTRVVDENHFEFEMDVAWPVDDQLVGGSDVLMIPGQGIKRFREPVFSPVRGWPQASCTHESRLWLGGSESLPDAAFGSAVAQYTDFDPGEGLPADAIQMFGIGQQARVVHMVSQFDLIFLTENAEFYAPGDTQEALTQERARALSATNAGTAYTQPQKMDGGLFFVEKEGFHIRELASDRSGYSAVNSSVVIPDWMKTPTDSTFYSGSTAETTPYAIFCGQSDGSALVMHSSRNDNSFGWSRWTIAGGSFDSMAGLGSKLFAVATVGGVPLLLEFDTTKSHGKLDVMQKLTAEPATTNFTANTYYASKTVKVSSGGRTFSDATLNGSAEFSVAEALTEVVIGQAMPFLAELSAPLSGSGQGPKAGKMQRLVDTEIHWIETTTGKVEGEEIIEAADNPLFQAPTPVDEWRQYGVGKWDREPTLMIEGDEDGEWGMRAAVLNVYF